MKKKIDILTDYITGNLFSHIMGKQTQCRETATEYRSETGATRHLKQVYSHRSKWCITTLNVMLNYTYGIRRDAPLTGDTQLSSANNFLHGKSVDLVENYSSPKRF
jgi:hypothetical protein